MKTALETPDDVIGQGSLLWRMVYESLSKDQKLALNLYVVRHEDLTDSPEREYEELYERVELPFTTHVRRTVARPRIPQWRNRLMAAEIARIETLARDVWPKYYTDADWNS